MKKVNKKLIHLLSDHECDKLNIPLDVIDLEESILLSPEEETFKMHAYKYSITFQLQHFLDSPQQGIPFSA